MASAVHKTPHPLSQLIASILSPLILSIGIPTLDSMLAIIRSNYAFFSPASTQETVFYLTFLLAPTILFGIILGITIAILLFAGSKLAPRTQRRNLVIATALSCALFAGELFVFLNGYQIAFYIIGNFEYQTITVLVFAIGLLFVAKSTRKPKDNAEEKN